MRRWSVLILAVVALGCDSMKQMFSARPEIAAEAAGQTLSVERLAQPMTSIKGVPQTRDAAEFIANMWVDHTLLAQGLARGIDLGDSALASEVLWPELAEARGVRWHDSLLAHRAPLNDRAADSVYNAGEVRLLQHILVRVESSAEPPVRAAGRKKADQLYAQAKGGANFGTLAARFSDDGSKRDSGYLQPAPRGKWVTSFDSAGWSLDPGQISPVIETPFGYHIIRRPPAAEVRDRMLAFTRERVGMVLDSAYLKDLGDRKHLKIASGAPGAMRKALSDPQGVRQVHPHPGRLRWRHPDGGRLHALGQRPRPQLAQGPGGTARQLPDPVHHPHRPEQAAAR